MKKLLFTALILYISFITISAQYCIPNPTYGAIYDTYIDSVSLADINYQDTYSPTDTSYTDVTNQYGGQTLLTRSQPYNLVIKGSPYYANMHYVAWIDYNGDLDFYDSGEKLGEVVSTSPNQVMTIAFTVPSNADIRVTRLRVRCVWNINNPNPCTDYEYGETEDYLVSVSDYLKVQTGIQGGMGDISFFNYNTDNDYDLVQFDEIAYTDPVLFYYNSSGNFYPFSFLNTPLPEADVDNLSYNLCDLNNDNAIDILFTYRYNSEDARTIYYERQGGALYQVNKGFANLKRGSSAAADLNNDGRQDVIICGQDADDVPHTYIYMNTPAGFEMVNDKLKGVYGKIRTVDYDNDMDIDIFITGNDKYGNTNAIIYRNDNNWNFTNVMADIIRVSWLAGAEFGDFNNDGRLDITVADRVYRNDGNDVFTEIEIVHDDFLEDHGYWCDLDHDGVSELITHDYYGVLIFKYNGSDAFILDREFYVRAETLDIGDYNGDNKQDILVNNYPEVSILRNLNPYSNAAPSPPNKLKSSVGDSGFYSVSLYWNNGSDDHCPSTGLTYNLRVGTTPGGNDIVSSMTSTTYHSLLKPGMGNVYHNNSWYLKDLEPGTYYWSVQAVDNSFLASSYSAQQQFTILPPLTESSFHVEGRITGVGAGADMDADSDIDIIISDSVLAINEQLSPYNYTYHKVNRRCKIIEIADLNNDNLPDIIANNTRKIPAEEYDSLTIYMNRGNMNFNQVNLDTLSAISAAAADFDNDGDIDILVHDEAYVLFENTGPETYSKRILPMSEILYYSSLSAIDIDCDNDMDFLVSGTDSPYSGNCFTYVYTNEGMFNFTRTQELTPGLGPSVFMATGFLRVTEPGDIIWGDYNFDGFPDLSLTGKDSYGNGNHVICLNDGTGKLIATSISPRPANKYSTSWIDFNTDGYLDLIMPKVGFNQDNIIYLNRDNNSYDPFPNVLDSLELTAFLDAIDVDNDRDKDIVCTFKIPAGDAFKTETKIYSTNNNFINYPPSAPAGISHEIDSFTVILSWNPGHDALTGNDGMTYNIRVGSTPGATDIVSPLSDLSTGYRFIEKPGNMGTNLSWTLENLPLGVYYWSVQSIDNSLQGSAWYPEQSFELSALRALFSYDTVCLGFTTTFTDESVSTGPIEGWAWNFGDGGTSTLQNPTHTFNSAGNHSVELIVRAGTFRDTLVKDVYVKPVPELNFSADVVCDGDLTTFVNNSVLNGLTITDWSWDFGDGSGSSVANPGTHGYLNPGDYEVILIALAENGCSDLISKTVSVGANPTAAITSSGNPEFCDGDSIILSNSTYNADYNYQWQIADVPITGATDDEYIVFNTGVYTVRVTNPVGNCSVVSNVVNVTSKESPVTPLLLTENYTRGDCLGENPVRIYPDQVSGLYDYQWIRNGVPLIEETGPELEGYLEEGIYSLEVDLDGCSAESDTLGLEFRNAPPKPDLYVRGPVVWYFAASNADAYEYKWYHNGNIIPGADKYIYVANQTLGTYRVALTNEQDGCYTMSDEITIPVTKSLMTEFPVPQNIMEENGIDPFGDIQFYPNPTTGLFKLEMENELFGKIYIRIFNDQGIEVFNTNMEKSTDHFINNIDLSRHAPGSYYIRLQMDNYLKSARIILE